MAQPTQFEINIPQAKLDALSARVAAYQPFPAPEADDAWQFGMSSPVLDDLQAYWLNTYDWRKAEAELNKYPHFSATVDGLDIHFVHVIGEAKGNRPLLLTHGWPGSFFEFWDIIGPLAYPSQYGGRSEDAFDLIIPSLPGYGFSGKPTSPIGPRKIASIWNTLMQSVLGYTSYFAQGGDWGGAITSWLGYDHGAHDGKGGCAAIHINLIGLRPTPATPQNDEEIAWLERGAAATAIGGGYFAQQATKPQTLAMALMDSPVGTAAWIVEKFHGWSDLAEGDLFSVYSRDHLLTNIMIYLVNDAIATSVWIYAGFALEGGAALDAGKRCETPTGIANFPGEILYQTPPRSWCDRAYSIMHWTDMPRGGHFAAMEAPDLFVQDVRSWAAKVPV